MALPPLECMYVVESNLREWKSGNSSFRVPNPVPVLRFLYELCWTMVGTLIDICVNYIYFINLFLGLDMSGSLYMLKLRSLATIKRFFFGILVVQ